jgi:hypothetical protein
MLFSTNWECTCPRPAGELADQVRDLVISERFFSSRRGEVLFQGMVSDEGFLLFPVVVEGVFGSVKPYAVQVAAKFEATAHGTRVTAAARMTDLFYVAFGLPVLILLGMFAFEIVVAPALLASWLTLFVPLVLLMPLAGLAYARSRLATSIGRLREALAGHGEPAAAGGEAVKA